MTQFGRALNELNIDIICANSPKAKGRVEQAKRELKRRGNAPRRTGQGPPMFDRPTN